VPFVIELQGRVVKGHALMDSGATNNFIDQQFVERYHIPTLQKDSLRKLHVADGREIDMGKITQEVKQVFNFGEFSCELNIDVTNMGTDDAVFGMPWLEDLGAKPDFENRTIRFSSKKLRGKPNKSYIEEVVRYNHSNQSYTIRCQTASLNPELSKEEPTLEELIPKKFHEFLDVFSPQSADKLPALRGGTGDMAIVTVVPNFTTMRAGSPNHSTPTAKYVDETRLEDGGHLRVLCSIYADLNYM
jgi:hypothetical protein